MLEASENRNEIALRNNEKTANTLIVNCPKKGAIIKLKNINF